MTRISTIKRDDGELGAPVEGGLLISNEQLARFFPGDLAKARKRLRTMLIDERDAKPIRGPVEKPPQVRIATQEDEPRIFELLLMHLRENALEVAPIDEDRVIAHIHVGTRHRGGFVGVIDGPDGQVVAVTVLHPAQWWWSRSYFVQEVAAFVHPDHRNTSHAQALLQFANWVADEWTRNFGYRIYMLTGVLTLRRMREKVRLYSRKATQIGAFFLYPFPHLKD